MASPSPRHACLAFGLRRAGRTRGLGSPPDEALAGLLAVATPGQCLDAAFALAALPPDRAVAAALKGESTAPPFLDRDRYAALARWLGCRFDPGGAVRRAIALPGARLTRSVAGTALHVARAGRQIHLFAPSPARLPAFAALIARQPVAARNVVVVPPHAFAGLSGAAPEVVAGQLDPLHAIPPHALADRVTTRGQAFALGAVCLLAVAAVLAAPLASLWTTVAAVTLVLLGYAGSRGLAIWAPRRPTLPRRALAAAELPVYSVLVPLYREDEEQLRHLVRALRRLDYPPDRLDIQFLVEADDPATGRAIAAAARELCCRVTVVPPGLPRTKPRALNVGFRQARGSLLTIFDAEDRPDPGQLRIAAETFAAAPRTLAALQARLAIDHGADSWLTRMFAIEYACQFDHILPMVASRGGLVLLGGTSNHFRVEALARAGGWDPYNVTEDADLAVRLRRLGYRIATIDSETHEEAPTTVTAWLKQRSRWFKGYMQTWLVHNRRPLTLVREIGLADAFLLHLFILGALTAAMAHVVFVVQALLALAGAPLLVGGTPFIVALQSGALVAGYAASLALGAVSVRRRKDPRLGLGLVLTFPVYWLLMGAAVLVALHDLARRPHHWHKTLHGLAARPRRLPLRWSPFSRTARPAREP